MKLLIFIPSPRDIKQFHDAIKKIPHDKLWMKNMPYTMDPYGKARKYFMKHKEYTHFAICPDDLIVTKEGVEQLIADAKKYSVVSGTCNVNMDDLEANEKMNLAMTTNLPTLKRGDCRKYNWIQKKDLDSMGAIISVPWSGTPFMILRRDVLEQFKFDGDGPANNATPFSFDVGIAHELKKLGIKQYVDTRVFFLHYRVTLTKYLNLNPSCVWLDTSNKRKVIEGKKYKVKLLDPTKLDLTSKPNWKRLKPKKEAPCPLLGRKHKFNHHDQELDYCLCGAIKT